MRQIYRFELDPQRAPAFASFHIPFEVELTGKYCGTQTFTLTPGDWAFSEEARPGSQDGEEVWHAVARRIG